MSEPLQSCKECGAEARKPIVVCGIVFCSIDCFINYFDKRENQTNEADKITNQS